MLHATAKEKCLGLGLNPHGYKQTRCAAVTARHRTVEACHAPSVADSYGHVPL